MISCNLAPLLAQRGLKMANVIHDTGVTRPTLMSLMQNTGKGIQFETINTLCRYLSVTPAEFFLYVPLDFEYIFDFYDLDFTCNDVYELKTITCKVDMLLKINKKNNPVQYGLSGTVQWGKYEYIATSSPLVTLNFDDSSDELEFETLKKTIPTVFYPLIHNDIVEKFSHDLSDSLSALLEAYNKKSNIDIVYQIFGYRIHYFRDEKTIDDSNVDEYFGDVTFISNSTLFNQF